MFCFPHPIGLHICTMFSDRPTKLQPNHQSGFPITIQYQCSKIETTFLRLGGKHTTILQAMCISPKLHLKDAAPAVECNKHVHAWDTHILRAFSIKYTLELGARVRLLQIPLVPLAGADNAF